MGTRDARVRLQVAVVSAYFCYVTGKTIVEIAGMKIPKHAVS